MSEPEHTIANSWHALRRLTQARIALGRAGVSVPTAAQLQFQLAHARARDAVHTALDVDALRRALPGALVAHSACAGRAQYLQRPDLGRSLDQPSRELLSQAAPAGCDVALVLADGLSAQAIEHNARPLLALLLPQLERDGWTQGPLVIAQQARVALGDEVGQLLKARAVVVLIGERPGLSSPDSMGIYMTWNARPGLTDESRNCISNIRPAGMSHAQAARKLLYLLNEARSRGVSGVALKDETGADALAPAQAGVNFLLAPGG